VEELLQKITVDRDLHIQEGYGDLLQRFLKEPLKKGHTLLRPLQTLKWTEAVTALRAAVKFGKTTVAERALGDPAIWCHWRVEPWVDADTILGALFTIQDVTLEKRRLEQKQLADKMSHMALLANQIAHRLNNPLATILNQLGYLLMDEQKWRNTNLLRAELVSIQEHIYRLSLITTALDAFARDAGAGGKWVQINNILEKTIEICRLLYSSKPYTYKTQWSDELPFLYANDISLEQCFLYLIRNALESMPEGGTVTIRTARIDDMVQIIVQDQGNGIAPEALAHVFEPFFKMKEGDHLGLGLSISYSIIAQYNGLIDLQSTPGKGTTVTILLPIPKSVVRKG